MFIYISLVKRYVQLSFLCIDVVSFLTQYQQLSEHYHPEIKINPNDTSTKFRGSCYKYYSPPHLSGRLFDEAKGIFPPQPFEEGVISFLGVAILRDPIHLLVSHYFYDYGKLTIYAWL